LCDHQYSRSWYRDAVLARFRLMVE
jgi:hypothetical protein